MPTGLLGLTIAGLTAALMGHLSATYNSIATLFTRDFYLKFRPQATQQRQILVGRIAVLAVFVLGACWAPIIGGYKSLFIYLQNISAYLMMPFAFIFFFGVFWKRINAPGVLACMLVSFVLCPVMLYNNQLKPEDQWFQFLNTPLLTPWLHRAMIVTASASPCWWWSRCLRRGPPRPSWWIPPSIACGPPAGPTCGSLVQGLPAVVVPGLRRHGPDVVLDALTDSPHYFMPMGSSGSTSISGQTISPRCCSSTFV